MTFDFSSFLVSCGTENQMIRDKVKHFNAQRPKKSIKGDLNLAEQLELYIF